MGIGTNLQILVVETNSRNVTVMHWEGVLPQLPNIGVRELVRERNNGKKEGGKTSRRIAAYDSNKNAIACDTCPALRRDFEAFFAQSLPSERVKYSSDV